MAGNMTPGLPAANYPRICPLGSSARQVSCRAWLTGCGRADADRHVLGRAGDRARCRDLLPRRKRLVDRSEGPALDELAAAGLRLVVLPMRPHHVAARQRVAR